MRTVKTVFHMPGPNNTAPSMTFSTEVIMDENTDPEDAGKEAGSFLMLFANGVASAAGPEEDD